MAHEEPEQHQEDQRSDHDCQGSSPRCENISSGLQKEFPFPISSKMRTFHTANEKGHSASPGLCACLTLLREQGVRNGLGFILVQAVESLQTGWPESARVLCQARLIISLPIRVRFPRAWYGSTFHEPSRDRPRRLREWRDGAFDGYSPRSAAWSCVSPSGWRSSGNRGAVPSRRRSVGRWAPPSPPSARGDPQPLHPT
jgi:hypothetical protein